MARRRLGELLIEHGLISESQLASALQHQRQLGGRVGEALVALGFISEGAMMQGLSESLQLPMVDLARVVPDREALVLLDVAVCEKHRVYPVALRSSGPRGVQTLILAMGNPLDIAAIDEIAFITDKHVRPVVAQYDTVDLAIARDYRGQQVTIAPLSFAKAGELGADEAAGEMTIVRAGREEVVHTHAAQAAQGAPGAQTAPAVPTPAPAAAPAPAAPGYPAAPVPVAPPGYPAAYAPPPPTAMPPPPTHDFIGEKTPAGGVMARDIPSTSGLPVGTDPRLAHLYGRAAAATVVPPTAGNAPFLEPEAVVRPLADDSVAELERRFWAMMRIMVKKGLITKQEFLDELNQG